MAATNLIAMAEQRGAKTMLDVLIGLGALREDHGRQALLPGEPVGLERLAMAMERAGVSI